MFSVSTRSRYGLRALIFIARHRQDSPVPLNKIAEAHGISPKYLENIFRILKSESIVESTRGAEGGYVLSRPPEDITLYNICKALDGPLKTAVCADDASRCSQSAECGARSAWGGLHKTVTKYLKSSTLNDILEGKGVYEN